LAGVDIDGITFGGDFLAERWLLVSAYRNRIKGLRTVPARDIRANPRNWRTHPESQQAALRAILKEVGWASALVARELPDGSLELIDGHLRADTAADEEVPVVVVDVTEQEAEKLLLSMDPLAALAESNAQALDSLMRDAQTGEAALAKMWEGLAEENGLLEDGEAAVTELENKPPPKMAWVVVGVPVVRYGEVQAAIEALSALPGVHVMSTANDRVKED
jgi:hypothetical protein